MKVVDALPEGFGKLKEGAYVCIGDFYLFKGRYVEVSSGSPYAGRTTRDVPGCEVFGERAAVLEYMIEPSEECIYEAVLKRGLALVQECGMDALRTLEYTPHPCACMGPTVSVQCEPRSSRGKQGDHRHRENHQGKIGRPPSVGLT